MGMWKRAAFIIVTCLGCLLPAAVGAQDYIPPDLGPLQGSIEQQEQQQQTAPLQGGVKQPLLQGGVEHSENLPPVDKKLHTGANFDETKFSDVVPNNLWVPIPAWFAGVWETKSETQLEVVDLAFGGMGSTNQPRTFARSDQWVFGMQVDKFNQIWHFINVPSYRRVEVIDMTEHRQELTKEFLYVADNRVLTRYQFTSVVADGQTQKIKQVRQQETVMLFKPESDDTMRGFGSIKLFTSEGLPIMVSRNYTPFYKVRNFSPVPQYVGIDMRQSFRNYLISHNLSDRLPDDLRAAQ